MQLKLDVKHIFIDVKDNLQFKSVSLTQKKSFLINI